MCDPITSWDDSCDDRFTDQAGPRGDRLDEQQDASCNFDVTNHPDHGLPQVALAHKGTECDEARRLVQAPQPLGLRKRNAEARHLFEVAPDSRASTGSIWTTWSVGGRLEASGLLAELSWGLFIDCYFRW
jgi:hypothetical protein